MKYGWKFLSLTALFTLPICSCYQQDSGLKTAPDFALKSLEGETIKLSDYRGKVVILDFWATWCPPCRMGIPDFTQLFREYSGRGTVILGVSVDRNGDKILPPFVKQYKINYPILLSDGKVEKAYGDIAAIPTTFVIDRKGEIYRRYVGYQPKSTFEKDINSLLEDQ